MRNTKHTTGPWTADAALDVLLTNSRPVQAGLLELMGD